MALSCDDISNRVQTERVSDYVVVIEKAQRERDAALARLVQATKLIEEGSVAIAFMMDHEWRPIETAPRDGTPVDLWIISAAPDVDHGMVDFYCPHAKKVKNKPMREGRITDVIWGHKPPNAPNWYPSGGLHGYPLAPDVKATHWMHRPTAPVVTKGDAASCNSEF